MKILFLSQHNIDLNKENLYSDFINSLLNKGFKPILVCADSSYNKTELVDNESYTKLQIKVGNQFGVSAIKKGLVLLSLERKIKKAIKKHLSNVNIDLILYATPPITFASVIKYCKGKYNCQSYLMLKDIFPQNAVDIKMMKKSGITGLIYKFFRKKEKRLYALSDKIGCMSQANIDYVLNHNNISPDKLEIFPNSIIIKPFEPNVEKEMLLKLGIDTNKLIFIYGGNLGKPQGLDFLVDGIKECDDINDIHFIIIGKGSEQKKVFKNLEQNTNATLLEHLPSDEYLKLCKECDVGIVMLDKRFTIPNYPSRTLAYMENALPILACTDKATDINKLIEEQAHCGKWIFSEDPKAFKDACNWFLKNKESLKDMGMNGRKYLENNFNVENHIYKIERLVESKKGE